MFFQILFDRMASLGKGAPPLVVLPVYSALPSELQTKIFEPAKPGERKVLSQSVMRDHEIVHQHSFVASHLESRV